MSKAFFDKADLIINATDPDREGELIFAYIYEVMHCTKKWKRVWIEDLTPQKIQYTFAHLKDSSEVISIQQAGTAAVEKYTAKYQARGYEVHSVFSKGKDVNEDLINSQKQNQRKR